MPEPFFVPEHNKPDAPGIWMNFDNTVSLYHIVAAHEPFEQAAQDLYALLKDAQARFPGWPRILYLEIDGHVDALGRFEGDFVELQQEFLFSTVAPFLTALETPLVSALNPELQRNDVPDRLTIGAPDAAYKSPGCA